MQGLHFAEARWIGLAAGPEQRPSTWEAPRAPAQTPSRPAIEGFLEQQETTEKTLPANP
jgi:hypothetical protein